VTGNSELQPPVEIPKTSAFQGTGLELLRASIRLLPIPASVVDLDSGRIVALNEQFAESLKLPVDGILDRTPDELGFRSNSDDRKAVLDGTVGGKLHHTHRRTKLPDGSWVEYIDSSRRILVDGRECLFSCYEPASRLVSEAESIRKEKESELRKSEERLRLVLEATSDGVFDWNIESGVVYFSPAYFSMLGYEPFGFPSSFDAWREHLHPDDLPRVEAAIQAHFSNPGRVPYLLEFRMKRKDGAWNWIQAKGKVVGVDAQGNPTRMVGTQSDITARKSAEERYRTLFENLTTGFALHEVIQDEQGAVVDYRFLEVNPAFEKLTGLTAKSLLGRKATEALPELEANRVADFGRVALTGEPLRFENHAASIDRWFETWAYQPAIGQFAVLVTDITDRKRQENAVRESEMRFREVADMSLDMLSRHDLAGICLWASPSCRQILSIEPDAVVGRSAFDFIFEEWHAPVREALVRLTAAGRSSLQYRIRRADGTGIWVETLWNLTRDELGNPLEILCSTRDISVRQRQEEILRDSEYFFKESQRASSTGSYRLHLDTGFWDHSETLGEILGIDESFPNNVEGWLDVVHPDDREMMKHHFEVEVVGNKGVFNKEYRIVRPCDHEIRWVHGQGELVFDAGQNPLHMIGTIRDITDRHRAEDEIKALNGNLEKKVQERTAELQVALKELESFSYSISHDLRSPLRAIDGFSKALIEDAGPELSAEPRMYLDRIRTASQHMGHLIDDLLQLSRSSRAEIVRRDIDVSAAAEQILSDLSNQSPARRLVARIDPAITIQGDSVLIQSVLENLLGNAWKYSSLKSESVIELSSETRDGRRWICIRDNGIGFDMAHADKLFGTFHRLHPIGQFEGTGIGLATVRKIVERHGGTVSAQGIPDQGAEFCFTLDPLPGARA